MKIRPFEIFLISFFVITAITSLILFRFYKADNKVSGEGVKVRIDIWGTLPAEVVNNFLTDLIVNYGKSYENIKYTYFAPQNFEESLTRALADNAGPDLVLFSNEELATIRRRIAPISYINFSFRNIKDSYIDGASVFALSDGFYGFPLLVDPLVMYWNEDLLSNVGYLEPPKTWERLINDMFPKLIKRNVRRIINRSVVAMGEYNNIKNSFAILSALTIQGGSKMVTDHKGKYVVHLNLNKSVTKDKSQIVNPFFNAVTFYTRFGRPEDFLYSWNKTFSSDLLSFLGGDLAFYFGFASEAESIIKANPNLNFDLTEIPQGEGDILRRTYGKFYSLAVLSTTNTPRESWSVLYDLARPDKEKKLAFYAKMSPVRKFLVEAGTSDLYRSIAFKSAPISFGWINPDRRRTDRIFADMVESINSAGSDVGTAVSEAEDKISLAY